MLGEIGNFFLALAFGFACVQIASSFWGVFRTHSKFLSLGSAATYLQGGFMAAAFLTLMTAFFVCDFSLTTVVFNNHSQLPWYYRIAATWGNHEGSLLFFVFILSMMGVTEAILLKNPIFKARTLFFQGFLTVLFLLFLLITSNPFISFPFTLPEGQSLNPLLQDRGLLIHPPLLYLGYVGFSAPFSLGLAALWGKEEGTSWASITRPWVLYAWAMLTAGIALGSWWAYYELGWGGWWFWDPVENASFMPWLTATALIHTLRTGSLYRWSLFLNFLTFGLCLLGTFLVRSGLVMSVHSFAQSSDRGYFLLSLLGGIMGFSFLMWIWKTPQLQNPPLEIFSRKGGLLLNSLLLCVGLVTVLLGTLYPLWSEWIWDEKISVGSPYFEKTFIPLILPLFILIPIGSLFGKKGESFFHLLLAPLTVTLGVVVFLLYVIYPLSLWAFFGISLATWTLGGTVIACFKKRLSLGATLAHVGIGVSLLGVSVGGGFRIDETHILGLNENFTIGHTKITLEKVQLGQTPTYHYERATLTSQGGSLMPEKRLYQPQDMLLSETAILTNGLKDLYVILGPYQGNNRWLIKASLIPLAPWIWCGGLLMALGAFFSLIRKKSLLILTLLLLPTFSYAESTYDTRAQALYKEVRCPECAGQSIADSETPDSKAIRGFIIEQLKEGKSDEMIRDELRTLFGDEILFHPPFDKKTYFLWFLPFGLFFLILLGFFWKGYQSRAK
ncbi:MAG: cytochrome c biogenesis protein CcsA [Proteobacteria bacterium]|nr:cytochrome c biogenesis protein CcsA [Pseudomonadota bacterium]